MLILVILSAFLMCFNVQAEQLCKSKMTPFSYGTCWSGNVMIKGGCCPAADVYGEKTSNCEDLGTDCAASKYQCTMGGLWTDSMMKLCPKTCGFCI